MNTVRIYLLFLFMIAATNTSFAGQVDDQSKEEPDCDYITEIDTFQYCFRSIEQIGGLRVAVLRCDVGLLLACREYPMPHAELNISICQRSVGRKCEYIMLSVNGHAKRSDLKHRQNVLMHVLRRSIELAICYRSYTRRLYKISVKDGSRPKGEVQVFSLGVSNVLIVLKNSFGLSAGYFPLKNRARECLQINISVKIRKADYSRALSIFRYRVFQHNILKTIIHIQLTIGNHQPYFAFQARIYV